MKAKCFIACLLCFVSASACNSKSSSSPAPAISSIPAVYPGDLSLQDENKPTPKDKYILKVTFLVDLDFPASLPGKTGEGELVRTQQVIQDGKIYSDFTPTWNNNDMLACGIDYKTTANDLSAKIKQGDVAVFDISTVETGMVASGSNVDIDAVTLMKSSNTDSSPNTVDQINCRGTPGNLTVSELVRTFGKDENGNRRIAAEIVLASDYEVQVK